MNENRPPPYNPLDDPKAKGSWFTCITYLDKDQINKFMQVEMPRTKYLSYIVHDKDVDTNGEKVGKHVHMLIKSTQPITVQSMTTRFKRLDFKDDNNEHINSLVRLCTDPKTAELYQIHAPNLKYKTDKPRYQYDESERIILYGDAEIVQRSKRVSVDGEITPSAKIDKTFEILELVMLGFNPYKIAKIYGRDFIYHAKQFFDLRNSILYGDNNDLADEIINECKISYEQREKEKNDEISKRNTESTE